MKLYYAPQSPFARKVRVAAIELGLSDRITLEYAKVVPGLANRTYADAVNPLRQVPALVADDGKIIHGSAVICDYLNALAGGNLLPPPTGSDRWRVLTNDALAQGMCDAVIAVRYETGLRPPEFRWPAWVDDQWDKIRSGLAWFNHHGDQLDGPLDISHITLGCLLGYVEFRFGDHGWTDFPVVTSWYRSLCRRSSFELTRPADPSA
ncbi:glutathione S-transferase family protein [Bradyrhizobium sp. Pear76]|uniref:glutathione S-transferase family protein n=1 Tax=Bradyrhizobium oropedii TaxID=1571201 RepID=UPI001E56B6EE|nr:glutathione S-transferase family protein [Bradyrhizobium oropedii]MCC8960763.1 glutathione S-transferase family protein [Bradyrhizobium oropedii]